MGVVMFESHVMLLRSKSMKRRGRGKDEIDLLDTNEQLELVDQLKREAARQGSISRRIFFVLFCLLGAIYVALFLQFYFEPWWMVHQEIFQPLVPKYIFLAFYALSVYISFASSVISLYGTRGQLQPLWLLSLCLAGAVMIFWTSVFLSNDIRSPYLLWMPLANLVCLFLAWYIDREMVALVSDVDTLDALVYKFNAA
jgi:hypothetical protein